MDINKIRFTPKANAFAEVYGKATGVPFIGELVAAAAGNGGEPTPPTPSVVESVTVYGTQESDSWTIFGTVTFNQDFVTENCDGEISTEFTLTIKDSSNTTICELWQEFYDCETNVFVANISDEGTLPTLPESGNYSIVVTKGIPSETIYEGTGTWTYEEPPVVESVTVTARQNSTSECQMYGMESCYELFTVMTLNQNWITSNCSEGLYYTLTIKDSSDNTIVETANSIWNCAESNVVEGSDYPEGSMPTFPESGNYVLSIYNTETPDIHIFDGTGTWTCQNPQI